MAMDHQSATSTFPLFSSLPAELRLLVWEQAFLPLVEPRIVVVHRDMFDPYVWSPNFYRNHFSFSVTNESFLYANDSFLASETTLSQVCTESRDLVQSFRSRFGLGGPQPSFQSSHLNELSLGAPLRPRGPHGDIFLCHDFTLLSDHERPFGGAANVDVGRAERWLVPVHLLLHDLYKMSNGLVALRWPLTESPHDIIALAPTPRDLNSLRYSDLVIVPADASRETVIPGLQNEDRDFILENFKQIRDILDQVERRRLELGIGPLLVLPRSVWCPNLYFAYVNSADSQVISGFK